MALKKSQLYSSLWQSCDELRGGMDASQYKDYVLTLLFVKYISDKYAGASRPLITVPEGATFDDIVKLKDDKEIGDKVNVIVRAIEEANPALLGDGVLRSADFNDPNKLGTGKEMVDRLTKLVGIFQGLDLRANRAVGDDLLGDAYEYLMRHFATESGKSKGQFYTPAEVSRILAQVVGIGPDTQKNQTVYDPTCGSGSLLLKAADQAPEGLTIYGQEMDNATYALARMNMVLHDAPDAEIKRGNTLASPQFTDDGKLKRFDFVVANPPFSWKSWRNGLNPENDPFDRFEDFGIPPAKQGDYAFLLHVVASLKSTGRAAVILPHGVLFRGNAEATIRTNLVRRGLIKGIIGLPPNLFYGTGIPACIVVIDRDYAESRKGVFMIDASQDFKKDGNKNRLRAQDIHRIVDTFLRQTDEPGYSRMVPHAEIEGHEFNLNLPRYIDATDEEDIHDLDGHLNGGIPERDVDALGSYWEVLPGLRGVLFEEEREGYSCLAVPAPEVRNAILEHDEFVAYAERLSELLADWRRAHEPSLRALGEDSKPKPLIRSLSEDLLDRFESVRLNDPYDLYQILMDYWEGTMQDDVYLISEFGWLEAARIRELPKPKKGEKNVETPNLVIGRNKAAKRYVADLIPPELLIARYFADEQAEVDRLGAEEEAASAALTEFEEEHTGDEGVLFDLMSTRGVAKTQVQERAMELKKEAMNAFPPMSPEFTAARGIKKTTFGSDPWRKGIEDPEEVFAELDVLYEWLVRKGEEASTKAAKRYAEDALNNAVLQRYAHLTEDEIKTLVVEDKWFETVRQRTEAEVERVTRLLAGRVRILTERYGMPLPALERQREEAKRRVESHLQAMGLSWN